VYVCTIPLTTLCSCETHYWHNQLLLPRCLSLSLWFNRCGPFVRRSSLKKASAVCVARLLFTRETIYARLNSFPAHIASPCFHHMRPQKRLFIIGRRLSTNQKGIKRRPDAFNALNWGCEEKGLARARAQKCIHTLCVMSVRVLLAPSKLISPSLLNSTIRSQRTSERVH
jgi:hypothetical protein